jgi:hypothetical protein
MPRVCLAILLSLLVAVPVQAQVMIPMYIPVIRNLPPVKKGSYEGIRTVAIISAIGQRLRVLNIGFLAPKQADIDITSWGIDEQLTAAMAEYLATNFEVKPISFDAAALAKIPNGRLMKPNNGLREFLAPLQRDGIDALIVVRPAQNGDTPGDEGLALVKDGAPVEWANFEVSVVDAKTLAVISNAQSRIRPRGSNAPGFAGRVAGPWLDFEDAKLSEAQMARVQPDLLNLASYSLIETLRDLDLGIQLPPPFARKIVPLSDDQNPFRDAKSVAVISALGDTFELRHFGSILHKGEDKVAIPSWGVDEHLRLEAEKILSQRFTVVPAKVDQASVANLALIGPDKMLKRSFPELPAAADTDLYVLLIRVPDKLFDMRGLSPAEGVGLWRQQNVYVFAHYAVVVLDAKTLELKSITQAGTPPSFQKSTALLVSDTLAADKASDLTPEKEQALRPELEGLLTSTLEETFLRLNLTKLMIADGPPPLPAATAN